MKTMYSTPEMEVVNFTAEDVITTSGLVDGGNDEDGGWGGVNG